MKINTSKSKAIITILGIQGGFVTSSKEVKFTKFSNKANYYFEGQTHPENSKEYFNTLPLLIEKYSDYEVIPIFTEDAKIFNEKVLLEGYPHLSLSFNDDFLIKDEKDFKAFFHLVEKSINSFDEVIVDVSHGFRHLPILMIIELIIQNFQDTKKIQKILFAKEIRRHEKEQQGLYEIIDLKEYLEIANITFLLTTFEKNYTVSSHISFSKKEFQKLAQNLNSFSEHFLSNSLKTLIDGDIIDEILKEFETLKNNNDISGFKLYLDTIGKHLEEIRELRDKDEFTKLQTLAHIMFMRGYMLNAITLLFESIGWLSVEILRRTSIEVAKHIDYFMEHLIDKRDPPARFSNYALVNTSRNFIKLTIGGDGFKGDYLFNPETIDWSEAKLKNNTPKPKEKIKKIHKTMENALYKIQRDDIYTFVKLIEDLEGLRNNLAHGNSSQKIDNVRSEYKRVESELKDIADRLLNP